MNTGSIGRAKLLLEHREIIFFEVWVDADEDVVEIAAHLGRLHCATYVDHSRRIIRAFAPYRKPAALDLA